MMTPGSRRTALGSASQLSPLRGLEAVATTEDTGKVVMALGHRETHIIIVGMATIAKVVHANVTVMRMTIAMKRVGAALAKWGDPAPGEGTRLHPPHHQVTLGLGQIGSRRALQLTAREMNGKVEVHVMIGEVTLDARSGEAQPQNLRLK